MDWFEIVAAEASSEAIFSGVTLKWLLAFKMDKMVTRGRLSIHLQEAPQLSKEWGEGQFGNGRLNSHGHGKQFSHSRGKQKSHGHGK
jgi:hypothetical protein